MKSLSNKNTKKNKIVVVSAIAVLLIGAATSAYVFREELGIVKNNDSEYTEPSEDEITGEDTSEQTDESEDTNVPTTDDTSSEQTDENAGEDTSPYRVTITSVDQDDTLLKIRTIISPFTSGGTCKLSLGKVGQSSIQQTAAAQGMSSYSTCQGFNVNTAGLEKGSWGVEITYTKDGKSSVGRGTAIIK